MKPAGALTAFMFMAATTLFAGSTVGVSAVASDQDAASTAVVAVDSADADCRQARPLRIAGSQIELAYDAGDFQLNRAQICSWIVDAARAVQVYYGRFPVPVVQLLIKPVDGARVSGGATFGHSQFQRPLMVIRLGRSADQQALDDDWVMTHEMVHLSVPSVAENSHWLEEGIATYVEPIARVQSGRLSAERIWHDMFKGMPQGLPGSGDAGLDRTPTWARTYWGGALFCLLADVEIRRRTGNAKGLQDALRGIQAAGGSIERDWPVQRVLQAGDAAVGVPVLTELYRRLATSPAPTPAELDTLWQQLGVRADGDGVRLIDDAPLAPIRRAITAAHAPA